MFDFKYFFLLEAAQFEPKEILTKANFSDDQADDLIKQLTAIILPYGEIDKSAKKLKYLYPLATFLTNPNVTIDQIKAAFDQYMSNEKARNSNLIYKSSIYDHVNMRGDFNAFKTSVAEQDKKAQPQQARKEISAEDKKQGNIRKARQLITLRQYNLYLQEKGFPLKDRLDKEDYLKMKEIRSMDLVINRDLTAIERIVEKYPDDEHTIDASYMVQLAKFWNQSGRGIDVFNTFDEYMSIDKLRNEKTIFKHDEFLKFMGEVHQEISSSLNLGKIKSTKMDQSEAVYVDKDIAVYLATTGDIFESIQKSIKYGQGNKFGLCISSKSQNHYTNYRFSNSTTTYFVYFKDPNIHNPNFIIVDAQKNTQRSTNSGEYNPPVEDNEKVNLVTADKYSWNPVVPNSDTQIKAEDLINKFPVLRDAFSNDVFKVLPISKTETETKQKYHYKNLKDFSNIRDKIQFIRFNHTSQLNKSDAEVIDEMSNQEAELLLKEILINRPELDVVTIEVFKKYPNLYQKYLKNALEDVEIERNGEDAEDQDEDQDEDFEGLRLKYEYVEAYKEYPEMFKTYLSLLEPYQLRYPNQMLDLIRIFRWFPEVDNHINYDHLFKTEWDKRVTDMKQAFRWMRDKDMESELEESPKAYRFLKNYVDSIKEYQKTESITTFRDSISWSERTYGKSKNWVLSFHSLVECPDFAEIIKSNNLTPEEIKKLNKANISFKECIFEYMQPLAALESVGSLTFDRCANNFYYLPKKIRTLSIKDKDDPVFVEDFGFTSKSKISEIELINCSSVDFKNTSPNINSVYIEDSNFQNFVGLPQRLNSLHFIQKHVPYGRNIPSFEGVPKVVDNLIIEFGGNTQSDIDKLGLDKFKPDSFNNGTNKLNGNSRFNNMKLEEYAKSKLQSTATNESFGGFLKTKSFLFEDLYKRMG
jgi:hypothetical protein